MSTTDRRSFDTAASQQVQSDLAGIMGRLETVIGDRDRAVKSAMADFTADGVSDQYQSVEQRWNRAANEVRSIIHLLRNTMTRNDDTAQTTLSRAGNAVASIG